MLAVVLRYRRGDEVERHQLKWLIAVGPRGGRALPRRHSTCRTPSIGNAAFVAGLLAMLALPLAIAVAILRYRLYEIDRIISRTIGVGDDHRPAAWRRSRSWWWGSRPCSTG